MLQRLFTQSRKKQNPLLASTCEYLGAFEGVPRVAEFISKDPEGRCQTITLSEKYSPGPVGDVETLARWVFTPPHVAKPLPGQLSDTFFEDIESNGMSVQRIHCHWSRSRGDIHHLGHRQVENDGALDANGIARPVRTYLGAIKFSARELRELTVEAESGSCDVRIYDTAEDGNPLHAEAMVNLVADTKKKKTAIRQQLRVRLYVLAERSGIFKSPLISKTDPHLVALNIAVKDAELGLQ